jgi:hypothetical protein
MITNANQGGLNGLLAERALLVSSIRRAIAAASLDVKAHIERELNVALFPYEIWVSLPDLRQRYTEEDCPYDWVLEGEFGLSAVTLLGPDGEQKLSMPALRGELHPRDGLRCTYLHLGVQTPEGAKESLDFARFVVSKMDEVHDVLRQANETLQAPIAAAKADFKRLETVNQALREVTGGQHGQAVFIPLLEDHEPFGLDFLMDDDEGGGLPPF